MKRNLFLFVVLLISPMLASAYYTTTSWIDGIKYGMHTESDEASVIGISGKVVEIPTTIKDNGKEYTVKNSVKKQVKEEKVESKTVKETAKKETKKEEKKDEKVDLTKLTVADLKKIAAEKDIKIPAGAKKADIIDLLK